MVVNMGQAEALSEVIFLGNNQAARVHIRYQSNKSYILVL